MGLFNFSKLLIITLILISNSINQLTVFPDHYIETDSPYSFSSSDLNNDIKERQIYKLGFFSTDTSNIKSYKFGVIYKPDPFCTDPFDETISKISSSVNPLLNKFFDSIKNMESTHEKDNFSEELELLKHYCSGEKLMINAPFPTLHNTGYILKYKLSMANDYITNPNLDINIKLRVMKQNPLSYEDNNICKFNMKQGVADWFKMTIKSMQTIANKITMIFICDNEDISHNIIVNPDDKFRFIFDTDITSSPRNIYISFYQVLLEDTSGSYYNDDNIIRTYNGLEECNTDITTEEKNCLIGYKCSSSLESSKLQCQKCDKSCYECDSSCINCNVLTDVDSTGTGVGSNCQINYIDISNFEDINMDIPLKEGNDEFPERSTMGFWIFISDMAKARTGKSNIYHVVLKDRYVISIIPNEISTGIYCHAYEDLYRRITSETIFESHYTDRESDYVIYTMIPSNKQLEYINNKRDLSGQWFHVSCGLSLDHKKFHVTTVINGEISSIESPLRHENLYYDSSKNQYVENDIYNRHIVYDKLNLEFRNFGRAGTNIYLKYFIFFQEYIPPDYKYMYFNLYQTNANENILLQIKFDNLITNNVDSYRFKYKNILIPDEQIESLKVSSLKTVDLTPPKNFKLLDLLGINQFYKNIDCNKKNENINTINDNNIIYWDIDKPLFCVNNYEYLNTKNNECVTTGPCVFGTSKYIHYPYSKYCDSICSGPMTCNKNYDINAPDNSYCQNINSNWYNLFYSCEDKETKYYFQYSSFYNSGNIDIEINPELDSYIIEIWYYPDFFLSDSNRQGKFYYPETLKNYIFYSNIGTAYFLHSEYKTLRVEDSGSTFISEFYHPFEWNKLMFYEKNETGIFNKYFIINNLINNKIKFRRTNHIPLDTIRFTKSILEVNDIYNNWATGYYRDLKIWDGSLANPELTILYDYYYSSGSNTIKSLKYYIPFSNEYISNNDILDINKIKVAGTAPGAKKLRRYNFSSKFDFIRTQYPSLQYFLLEDASSPKAFPCDSGCLRCWNSGKNCYECKEGYILTLERECIIPKYFYFKSPCEKCGINDRDAVLKIDHDIYSKTPITVTFWVKTHGFNSGSSNDFINYGDNNEGILKYYETSYKNCIGLCLLSKEQIIAYDENFRDKIGKWTYISLSYYDKMGNYFPKMINFEINGISIEIKNDALPIKFNKFIIKNNLYAFFFNIRYYHEYLIGAYGFATNKGNLISPFFIPQPIKTFLVPGNTASNCLNTQDFENNNGQNFGCGGDQDKLFDTLASSFNNYIQIEKGYGQPKNCLFKNDNNNAFCFNACKGNQNKDCTCLNKNYNSQMLIKDENGIIYCKTLKYINFSKAKDIKIKVKTAKETKKFTLQFWMYFYNYEEGNFKGATFNWNGHNKIIIYEDDKKYYTKCEVYTIENKNLKSIEIEKYELNINKWNFISCSVNYQERFYYLNVNNDKDLTIDNPLDGPRLLKDRFTTTEVPEFIQNNDYTYLQIKDDTIDKNEWGYLFYRQIHLWKDAYFNAEFLSRVNILTPSKFPYLLHSWDTHFRGYKDGNFKNNFIIKDLCNSAEDIIIDKTETLGFNYIPELESDKDIELCSEDGEYYDLYTKNKNHCLPFADLGLIDDFNFIDIPNSYSGSYSMAFWIFFEDSSTMSSGIHFKWERHLQITVIKSTQLLGYCLPQGYYSDDIPNSQFNEKLNKIPNFKSSTLVTGDQSESGNWIWVLCSVSNYAKKYFIKGNGPSIPDILYSEDLYYSDLTNDDKPVKNKYPYHYFMSEIENGTPITSKLYIEGLANDKRIYIRDLFLFNDYIPEEYAEAFKNTDLSLIEENKMLQSMIFVCNFADFNLNKMTLTYYVINQNNDIINTKSTYTKTKKIVKLYRSSKISSSKTFELCSNFAFIKILNPQEGALCQTDATDNRPNQNFYYCNEDKIPIVCREPNYLQIQDGFPTCIDKCTNNYYRIPGTPYSSGICNIDSKNCIENVKSISDTLNDYSKGNFTCDENYNQIGYSCFKKDLDENSALFFSRCYNQPNFYGEISNEIKEQLPNGYFYEFWFKLDKVQILNHCETKGNEEYILFSTPHSIYLDRAENKYYYKIIDSIYSSVLDGIHNYEWNKIVIKTTLGVTLGQNVYVYINFDIDNIKAIILNIPSSIKMQLQYISFCTKEENGDCTPAGTADITWGSAYYKNIRIWELYSTSIYSIQDFNIGIYENYPLSLKLYYPLKISTMNYNVIHQVVSNNIDEIKVGHKESQDFKSLDKWDFYNYADNFDWGMEKEENKKRYISSMNGIYITSQNCNTNCERCYTNSINNCYKCSTGYVLKGKTCVQGKTYLKIPCDKKIRFEINNIPGTNDNINNYPGITITFYMKFEGVVQENNIIEQNYKIIELKPNTFLSYEPSNSNLDFYIEPNLAFRYPNYYNLIGQWIPYSISIYISKQPEIYPHMFTFSINKEDIPFISGFTLPDTLLDINYLNLGDKVIAIFADLRIYKTFIQGAFGHSISDDKDKGLLLHYSLQGNSDTNCIHDNMLSDQSVNIKCVTDYTDYMAKSCGKDLNKYFDLSIPGQEPCDLCSDYCKTKCFNKNENQCTCDLTNGLYWLRRDKITRQTYCEYLPYIDYSIIEDISMTVPTSQTYESTLEFWLFIYSYNSETIQFKKISIIWNLHNRVLIENKDNTLYVYCYAFYDKDDTSKYTEYITLTISAYSWIYIRCGTDYISQNKKYFLNNQEMDLITTAYPDRNNLETTLNIETPLESNSFGYVFLKDIKLWQQYNFNYINTQYINLLDEVGLYKSNNKKSEGIFPGLITYIKSDFIPDDYENTLNNEKYKLINLVGIDKEGYPYKKTYEFNRKNDFLGYNIIDPDNYGYYTDLIICNKGYVYSSENNMCIEVSVTKCKYPGDMSDNCISCPNDSPYIYPPNGNCVNDCGVRFYPRDDMLQCRECHPICYECWGSQENACISCTENLYLLEDEHKCIPFCHDHGLIADTKRPNLCVPFLGYPVITNYDENIPIDINTFNFFIVELKDINTKPVYINWKFDHVKTRAKNPGLSLNFKDDEVPFYPNTENNLRSYNISLNKSFFELKRNYCFIIDVHSYNVLNNTKEAIRSFNFTFKTNSYPENGTLEIFPEIGLHNTTIFIIKCQNWEDDTSDNMELMYYFYSKENSTNETIILQDWSYNNEITTKFILEKESFPNNNITIYCKIRDKYLAETEVKKDITIVTNLTTGIYSLENELKDYNIPSGQLQPIELFHISQVLMSLGEDLYKILRPNLYQSIYRPSVDKKLVIETKPECITLNKECNNRGECNDLIDEFLVCKCEDGYIGTNCHIDKNGGDKLLNLYIELYSKLISTLQSELSYYEFKVIYNIFKGAHYFCERPDFFINQLQTFFTMALSIYQKSVDNNTYEYIDLLDFYFSYEYERLNKARVNKKYNEGFNNRDIEINEADKNEFKEAFEYIHNELINLLYHKCNMHLNTQIEYEYSSSNFYIAIKSVNPTFNEDEFFKKRKNNYKSFPHFMKCLNYIESNKLNNPYFQTFMIYIEYIKFPFAYDEEIYKNNTSPLIELKFLDAITGKNFDLTDCNGPYQINIDTPFTNYRSLEKLNEQKILFDPKYYKSPNDAIFSDPIYINESGYVSDDTVNLRIEKYHRKYNFSCRYYDIKEMKFLDKGIIFTNFTSDTNFIEFNTTHLSRFSTFFIDNNASFNVKGRFFYVPRTELLNWKGNFKNNFGFIIFLIILITYFGLSIILGCYDNIFFVRETLLESLKTEIVKSFLPYKNKKEREKEALKLIPISLDPNLIEVKKFGDKTKDNKRYDNIEDTKNEDDIIISGKTRDINNVNSGDRLFKSNLVNNKSKEFLSRKNNIGQNIMTSGNKTDLNLELETKDYYASNIGKKETEYINVNRFPEIFEDDSIEYNRRLYGYANLNLTFFEFLGKNILSRNILINPFININMFCPRWKKLIIFTTNIYSELLLLSIFLTNDEKAIDTKKTILLKYSIYTILITDTFMHFMTIFFKFSEKQKRRLLRLVLHKGQLIVMKEYEDMQCANNIFTVFGTLICYTIWGFAFYMSFAFYSVWKNQNKAYIYSFLMTIGLDFIGLDCFYELILAVIYMQRKTSEIFRVIGEFLNRVRNHRCMA